MNQEKTLKVALIQSDLVWENPAENRKRLENKINSITDPVDLIVLPEMFTTGFTMNVAKVAETMNGETVHWLQRLAQQKSAAITGSIVIKEKSSGTIENEAVYFNRLLFVHPSKKIDVYDKRHRFTLAGEQNVFTSGNKKVIITYKGWKICPLICYDLRFPVWARNIEKYDLLMYVASWPKPRIKAWKTLLKARAIENMSYTIGVNRVGVDSNNYQYNGKTICYDALGNSMIKKSSTIETIFLVTLDKNAQDKVREKLPFLEDSDTFTLL
ncbi:amidohydrolase [Tenacibaculum sp. UWU-22]|uniref:amidohydrolase n=1 Tax=Tenacibaculum sp. UWU-22 TaxID=3234187 RepID=UPI0034DB6607